MAFKSFLATTSTAIALPPRLAHPIIEVSIGRAPDGMMSYLRQRPPEPLGALLGEWARVGCPWERLCLELNANKIAFSSTICKNVSYEDQ